MHETLFAESLGPGAHECLFLPLRPYSLGHEILLWRAVNPLPIKARAEFDALPADEQRRALVEAVDICGQDWREYAAGEALLSASPRWNDFGQRRRQKRLLRVWRDWKRALDRLAPEDWLLAVADFRIYLAAGRAVLPVLNSDAPADREAYQIANGGEEMTAGRALGSPLLAQLVEYAQRARLDLVFGAATVFDVPFAGACNLFYAALENEGRLSVENAREAQARTELAAHREEIRRENAEARAAWESCATDDERRAAVAVHPRIVNLFPEAEKFEEKATPCQA